MRTTWDQTDRVLLRCDPDLVGALLDADRDTEIGSNWLSHMRFRSAAFVFSGPLRIPDDDDDICLYRGFFAAGTKHRDTHSPSGIWTTYHAFSEAEDVRLVWLFGFEGSPNFRGGQTLQLPVLGPSSTIPRRSATSSIGRWRRTAPRASAPTMPPCWRRSASFCCPTSHRASPT
jgi:hypothetical protein